MKLIDLYNETYPDLLIDGVGIRMKITICDGVTVELWELRDRWNRLNDEDDAI